MHGIIRSVGPIAGRTRWLAILAGCVAAITGAVSVSLFFPIVPSLLIFRAIAQPRFHRSGFWLMLVGALFLSLYVLSNRSLYRFGFLQNAALISRLQRGGGNIRLGGVILASRLV